MPSPSIPDVAPRAETPRSPLLGNALGAFGIRPGMHGRWRVLVRAQLPFLLVLAGVVAPILLNGRPTGSLGDILVAGTVAVAASVAMLLVPWQRFPEITGIVVGAADIASVAFLSDGFSAVYPAIGVLVILPVAIMAYAFGPLGLVVGIAGSAFGSVLPAVHSGQAPHGPVGWINFLLMPSVLSMVAVAAYAVSILLQRSRVGLEGATRASAAAAREADDQRMIILTVLDTLDVGTAFVRPDRSVAFTNIAYRHLIERAGFDAEIMAGTKVYAADRTTPLPPEDQMLAQVDRGEYFESRLIWVGDPGQQRATLVTARPVLREDGATLGAAFVSKDVTDLANAVRIREEFLAGVSHELRTPLTSIIGYLDIISESIDPVQVGIGRELEVIQRNANQLLARIGDLLHVGDHALTLRRRIVEIPVIVEQAVDAIRIRADEAGITIRVEVPPPFTAVVDANRFAQILDNLLTNAVKYTPAGGTVWVALEADDDSLVLTVEDDGTGIAEQDLDQVFDRFYRTESVRDQNIPGAGLGLAIVRNIIESHHGTISVISALGEGTLFTVALPRTFEASAASAARAGRTPAPDADGRALA
jgi:two-component system, OmpR family, phosphate regulon sensor histidine kinase PhoR